MARKAKVATRATALEYFKYNPATDDDQTFNIDLALNQNWDKTKAEFERQGGEIEAVKQSVQEIEIPTSLPANGGNADTVDGLHPYQIETLNASGGRHGNTGYVATLQHNVHNDNRFKLQVAGGLQTRVDYATGSDEAWNAQVVKGRDIAGELDAVKSQIASGGGSGVELAKYSNVVTYKLDPSGVVNTVFVTANNGLDILSFFGAPTNGGAEIVVTNGGRTYTLRATTSGDWTFSMVFGDDTRGGACAMPLRFKGHTTMKMTKLPYEAGFITYGLL